MREYEPTDPKHPIAFRLGQLIGQMTFPHGWSMCMPEWQDENHALLQIVAYNGVDNVTGEPYQWKGRKWVITTHMTDGEIIQTIFKAILTAAEHELRETFLVAGRPILDPHYDLEKLWDLRGSPDALKERELVRG